MPANKQPGKVIDNMYDLLCHLETIENQSRPSIINRLLYQLILNNNYPTWLDSHYNDLAFSDNSAQLIARDIKYLANCFDNRGEEDDLYHFMDFDNELSFKITSKLYKELESGQLAQSNFYLQKLKSIYQAFLDSEAESELFSQHKNPEDIGAFTHAFKIFNEVMMSETTINKFKSTAISIAAAATIIGIPAIAYGLALEENIAFTSVAATATAIVSGKVGFFTYNAIKNACKSKEYDELNYSSDHSYENSF